MSEQVLQMVLARSRILIILRPVCDTGGRVPQRTGSRGCGCAQAEPAGQQAVRLRVLRCSGHAAIQLVRRPGRRRHVPIEIPGLVSSLTRCAMDAADVADRRSPVQPVTVRVHQLRDVCTVRIKAAERVVPRRARAAGITARILAGQSGWGAWGSNPEPTD